MKGASHTRVKTVVWLCGITPKKMGGFERHCIETAAQLKALGFRTYFVFDGSPSVGVAEQLEAASAKWQMVKGLSRMGWQAVWPIVRLVWVERPVLLHLHLCKFNVLLVRLLSWLSVPVVVTYHISGPPGEVTGLWRWLRRCRGIFMRNAVRGYTAVSKSARDKLCKDALISQDKVRVIYNGTVTDTVPEGVLVSRRDPFSIFFAGALIPEKGVHVAIEAVAVLRRRGIPADLTIAGDGPESAALQSVSDRYQLGSNVRFIGLRADVPALMTQFAIVVVPSLWHEAFGLVVIEAMAAGCTVVASRVGGIPEVISDGVNGVLVPPGEAVVLADALGKLIADSKLRENLVVESMQTVRNSFSLETIVKQYCQFYAELGFLPVQVAAPSASVNYSSGISNDP